MSLPISAAVLADFVAGLCEPQAITALLEALARSDVRDRLGLTGAELASSVQELERLQAEKAVLERQLEQLRLPDVERLLVFLPAIYRNFWGVVRPDEVAMLAGSFKVISVPSPFPDPTPDTILAMKRQLTAMAAPERDKIIGFCRALPHRLQIRAEMRDFF